MFTFKIKSVSLLPACSLDEVKDYHLWKWWETRKHFLTGSAHKLTMNWKMVEVTFTASARRCHVVGSSVARHYLCFFSIIPILHKQEARTWHLCKILCNAPTFLLLILHISSLDTFIISSNRTLDFTKKINSRMSYVTSFFFAKKNTKRPNALLPIQKCACTCT